jgi:hypothetical protein
MKRVSTIFPDQTIVVDGVGVKVDSDLWVFDVPGAHAIQWYETEGDIEFATVKGKVVRPAEPFTDRILIQALIDTHANQLQRNQAALEAAQRAVADFVDEQKRLGQERLLADRVNPIIQEIDETGALVAMTSAEFIAIKQAEMQANMPEPTPEVP